MKQSAHRSAIAKHTAAIDAAHRARAASVAQSARISDLVRLIEAGDTVGLARHLLPVTLDEPLRAAFVAGGQDEADSLPAWAAAGSHSARRTQFDPSDAAAADWLARFTARATADYEMQHRASVGKAMALAHDYPTSVVVAGLIGKRNPRTGNRQGGTIHRLIDAPALAREAYDAGRRHLHQQAIAAGVSAQRALRTYRRSEVRDAAPQDSVDFRIASALIEHSIQLLRVEAGINAEVQAILTQMERELMAQLAAGGLTTFAEERLAGMLEQTKALIAAKYAEAERTVDAQDLADLETNFTARTLAREIGVTLARGIVPEVVLRSLVGNLLIQGAPSAEWWAQQSADTAFRFANAVRQGVAQNETIAQVVKRIETSEAGTGSVLDTSRRQVASLVRTSVQTVTNAARRETYAQNDDVILGTRQISTLDARTSTICVAYSGAEWDLDRKPIKPNKLPYNGGCPRHWNCFVAETPVSSPAGVSALYRRQYSGELISIRTHHGRAIRVTPNHPILTEQGWKTAGSLEIGDKLVCDKQWGGAHRPKNKRGEATFFELAQAATKLFGVLPIEVPLSAPDFHGDTLDNEIGQVWTNSNLLGESNAPLSEMLRNSDFQRRYFDVSEGLPREGHLHELAAFGNPPSSSLVCSRDRRRFTPRPAGMQVFGSRAIHAELHRPSSEIVQSDGILGADFPGRKFVGDVLLDDVEFLIRSEAKSVWVHNLETDVGWYLADGIISHNCRSVEAPIVRELAPGVGEFQPTERAAVGGPVAASLTFSQWLETKPAAFQNELLGEGRAALWRSGRITLAQLLDQSGNPLTLAQLRAKYAS